VLAHVCKGQFELVDDLVADTLRYPDATRSRQSLEAGRHIHAVAINIVAVNDYVADIDTDSEFDAVFDGHIEIPLVHCVLHIVRAAHGVDDARKLDQETVACGLDDAPAVLGNLGVHYLFAVCLETREGALLVGIHQSRVARHISCDDRCQLPFDPLVFHGAPL
jgi:hypothetical protein